MNDRLPEIQKEWHGTLRSYLVGFIASLLLTGVSFFLVAARLLTSRSLIYALILLAIVQAFVQVRYFLHVGEEGKPHWESWIFYFMLLLLLCVALGSIWVINDLNERMMPEM